MSAPQLGSHQPPRCDVLIWAVYGGTAFVSRFHLKVLKVLQIPSADSSLLLMCPNGATSKGFRVLTSCTIHLKLYRVQTLEQESPGLHLQLSAQAFPWALLHESLHTFESLRSSGAPNYPFPGLSIPV